VRAFLAGFSEIRLLERIQSDKVLLESNAFRRRRRRRRRRV